jgi:hypothetical protein
VQYPDVDEARSVVVTRTLPSYSQADRDIQVILANGFRAIAGQHPVLHLQSSMDRLATPEDVGQDLPGVELPFYLKDNFLRQNVNFCVLTPKIGNRLELPIHGVSNRKGRLLEPRMLMTRGSWKHVGMTPKAYRAATHRA